MLADALPDRFGNRLIDAWLAETGRSPEAFNPVDRLCYIGRRGIGALEFEPALRKRTKANRLEVARLVDLANRVLDERTDRAGRLDGKHDAEALEDILSVGTSAGGARAKAVLAWNPETGEFRSGQLDAEPGFEHWLLKFDGVSDNRDKERADPEGYGRIEYAYARMARAAGIAMSECRLHHEADRSHFMTKRFDRDGTGRKIHMQSLGAMRHFDFNDPSAYSYEQAVMTIRDLGLGMVAVEEQFRRAVFNVIVRNQDDHVKNIAFLMDRGGHWSLSPAYDVTYAYNPGGAWTRDHQMSLAGRRSGFELDDILQFAASIGVEEAQGPGDTGRDRRLGRGLGATRRSRGGRPARCSPYRERLQIEAVVGAVSALMRIDRAERTLAARSEREDIMTSESVEEAGESESPDGQFAQAER